MRARRSWKCQFYRNWRELWVRRARTNQMATRRHQSFERKMPPVARHWRNPIARLVASHCCWYPPSLASEIEWISPTETAPAKSPYATWTQSLPLRKSAESSVALLWIKLFLKRTNTLWFCLCISRSNKWLAAPESRSTRHTKTCNKTQSWTDIDSRSTRRVLRFHRAKYEHLPLREWTDVKLKDASDL